MGFVKILLIYLFCVYSLASSQVDNNSVVEETADAQPSFNAPEIVKQEIDKNQSGYDTINAQGGNTLDYPDNTTSPEGEDEEEEEEEERGFELVSDEQGGLDDPRDISVVSYDDDVEIVPDNTNMESNDDFVVVAHRNDSSRKVKGKGEGVGKAGASREEAFLHLVGYKNESVTFPPKDFNTLPAKKTLNIQAENETLEPIYPMEGLVDKMTNFTPADANVLEYDDTAYIAESTPHNFSCGTSFTAPVQQRSDITSDNVLAQAASNRLAASAEVVSLICILIISIFIIRIDNL